MMKIVLFIFSLFAYCSAYAFLEPSFLKCNLTTGFVLFDKRKSTGEVLLDLKKTSIIQVLKDEKLIAKIYPKYGLDYVLLDKKNFSARASKSSFSLSDQQKNIKVFCEFKE